MTSYYNRLRGAGNRWQWGDGSHDSRRLDSLTGGAWVKDGRLIRPRPIQGVAAGTKP